MIGNKLGGVFQRVAVWCKAINKSEDNSSLSFRSKGDYRVESDGLSRYRETILIDVVSGWIRQIEWYRGAGVFVSFMQSYETVA